MRRKLFLSILAVLSPKSLMELNKVDDYSLKHLFMKPFRNEGGILET